MCGIVGYTGSKDAVPILMDGLEALAYRGYDSAGIAVYDGGDVVIRKAKGALDQLQRVLEESPVSGDCGIGHTRWATHGEPSFVNSHPHTDAGHHIALVHNGIIENYLKLKTMLEKRGCQFVSETDTEVVAQLLGKLYTRDKLAAVYGAMRLIEGSFALAILFEDEPHTIYCACKDSPMVVGLGDTGAFVASDIPALLAHTRDVCFMGDGRVAVLHPDRIEYYDEFGKPEQREATHIEWDVEAAKKGNFEHFMLKEIFEEPEAFKKTLDQYTDAAHSRLKAEMFPLTEAEARALCRVTLVSCGTAYHAAMLGKRYIEALAQVPADAEIASEFRYADPILDGKNPVLIVSQSGETADSIAAMRMASGRGCTITAITNVIGSTVAREAGHVLYTYAGPEIAVAATKSYLTQLAVLFLYALDLAQKRGAVDDGRAAELIRALYTLPALMKKRLAEKERIQYFASRAFAVKHVFFIGRGLDHALALEAALKLKEISYIHSEAYAAGELKHGTIALIEDGSLVVALATQPRLFDKMASNMEEVRVRGAQVLALTNGPWAGAKGHSHEQWEIEKVDPLLAPMLAILPMQLFAYYIAVQKGCSVDKPRNLAKSVTVE